MTVLRRAYLRPHRLFIRNADTYIFYNQSVLNPRIDDIFLVKFNFILLKIKAVLVLMS